MSSAIRLVSPGAFARLLGFEHRSLSLDDWRAYIAALAAEMKLAATAVDSGPAPGEARASPTGA